MVIIAIQNSHSNSIRGTETVQTVRLSIIMAGPATVVGNPIAMAGNPIAIVNMVTIPNTIVTIPC